MTKTPDSENPACCPECGRDMVEASPGGLCSKCLVQLAIGKSDDEGVTEITAGEHDAGEAIGSTIGRYRLLEQIGEGGFGVVYMAEQREPVTRRVALKIIKLGMDTKQVIARFEAERQALALMEHPNIAKVLDAGTTESGRPYFVMELVRGAPITDYCNQRGFNTDARLALFKQVCLAVQHAHQKGIIHRDLKPNNILVATNGDEAVPIIIDFGIAKATQGRLTDKTLFTQFHQFIGTPEYMSPEQVQMGTIDVDTRSDIYSLGVLLYELLTGKRPLDAAELRKSGYEEMCRRIREDTAPKPSRRLTSIPSDELTTLAKQRSVTPVQFASSISGDLDWIVMKAVEKDVSRRYDSCGTLAADIERYRKKEPVLAGPPSAIYHLQKFAQRHRVAALAGIGVALALIAGTGIALYGMAKAVQEKNEAEDAHIEARKAEGVAKREKKRAEHTAYLADMQAGHAAIKRNNLGLARRILERNREFPQDQDPRHWEWRALWAQCQGEAALTLTTPGDDSRVTFAVSPDGESAVLAGGEVIQDWDLNTGTVKGSLTKEIGHSVVAFAPSGDRFFAGQGDRIRCWEYPSLKESDRVFTHDRRVIGLEVTPDGQRLVAFGHGSPEKEMNLGVWDLQTGQLHKRAVVSHSGSGLGGDMKLSLDGKLIGIGPRLRILDIDTLDDHVKIEGSGRGALAFSADGKLVAESPGLTSKYFEVHRLKDGASLGRFEEHLHGVSDLAFSPDGRFLASASRDQTVVLWNASTFDKIQTFQGHGRSVGQVRFTTDSQRLISRGRSTLCVWDLPTEFRPTWPLQEKKVVIWPRPAHSQVSYSSDARLLATTSSWNGPLIGTTTLRSPETLEILHTHSTPARGLRFSPVDPNLLAVGENGSLVLYDASRWEERARVRVLASKGGVFPVRFTQDGERLLVMAQVERNVSRCVIYRVSDLSEVTSWTLRSKEKEESPHAAMSPDGTKVVVGGYWGLRLLWPGQPPEDAEVLFPEQYFMGSLDYSPDGKLLAVGGGGLFLLNPETGETIAELPGHISGIGAVRFSPDGKRLASAGEGKYDAVKLWDVATRREILTLEVGGYRNRQLEWSPDGNTLLMVGGENAIHLWQVPSFEDIERAEATQ